MLTEVIMKSELICKLEAEEGGAEVPGSSVVLAAVGVGEAVDAAVVVVVADGVVVGVACSDAMWYSCL